MKENDSSVQALKLCIIIPVFNRVNVTLRCLEQLYQQDTAYCDIIIVDDGSQDGTSQAICKQYPKVHIVKGTGNWWYTRSVNEGLKYALRQTTADGFLLLNNDIDFSDRYIDAVSNMLTRHVNEPIIFGSVSFDAENTGKPVFLGIRKFIPWLNKQHCYSLADYFSAKEQGLEAMDSAFLPGRGMFFSKNTLLQNGLLDEQFPQYTSDFEFSARGKNTGIKTQVCLAAVLYSHEKLTGAGSPKNKPTFRQFLHSLFNKYSPTYPINNYRLIRKHIGTPLLMPLTFLIVLSGKFKAYFKYKHHLM